MRKKYITPEMEFNALAREDILEMSVEGGGLFGDDMDSYLTYLDEGNQAQASKYYQ